MAGECSVGVVAWGIVFAFSSVTQELEITQMFAVISSLTYSDATAARLLSTTMNQTSSVDLKRECPAVQIPAGNSVTLPNGTTVQITQTLGGSYTVQAPGGLFRIAPQDADALGFDVPKPADAPSSAGPVNEKLIWDTLRTCFDPEIPVNIVDLGLVYDMKLSRKPGGGSDVDVKMTLTAPGCGMGPAIAGDAQIKLLNLPGVEDAHVEIVWDPPWHHSMITEQGRKILGLE
jgi:probable FeS assembly SUF system protein SufT